MNKLLSGRFWLTIIAGIAFLYAVIYNKLQPEAISAILSMVFVSYFQKDKNGEK